MTLSVDIKAEGMAIDSLGYYRASYFCSSKGSGISGSASLMNAMFAIELALKSIHVKHESKAWGHKIKPLLDSLPSDHKVSIANELRSRWEDFDIQLENCNNAFVVWRYKYESKGPITINHFFVLELAEVCCRAVIEEFTISCSPDIPSAIRRCAPKVNI